MKIGIVGVGMVGGTIKFGLERLGHDVRCHDINWASIVDDVLETELAFVCVPTPSRADGSCDVSIVEQVVKEICDLRYEGLIVVKSTVTPGTTERLTDELSPRHEITFCPEFLRERTAIADFCDYHDVCIVGTHSEDDFDLVRQAHGHYPRHVVKMTPTEAELAKYFSNVFNALRITFANQFFDVCNEVNADYTTIKNAIGLRNSVGGHYLECNPNLRAYGGNCLPKDVKAFRHFVRGATKANPALWALVDALNETTERVDDEANVA